MAKKDIEIQPGFEPGSSEFQSDAIPTELLHGTLAVEQRIDGIYPYRHSSILKLDLS